MAYINRSLHWTQRVALVRHNLHTSSRSGDFSFFKHLQAQGLIDGINHVAILTTAIGDDADFLLAALDDLNAGIAQVHEDAFRNVYTSIKESFSEEHPASEAERRLKVYVDITLQKQMADMSIDKTTNSAIALIQQQSPLIQDTVASVWIEGTTMIADSMQVALNALDSLETNMMSFIRLENSWATVNNSTSGTISALRGIYNLMDISNKGSETAGSRRSSIAAATGVVFRRLSYAMGPATSSNNSRSSSLACRDARHSISGPTTTVFKPMGQLHNSISGAIPDKMPGHGGFEHTNLSPIPHTPGSGILDEDINPFDTTASPPVPVIPTRHRANAILA